MLSCFQKPEYRDGWESTKSRFSGIFLKYNPGCQIERSVIELNRTPIVQLGSVIEHIELIYIVRSIDKIFLWSQENLVNWTQLNIQLQNGR